MLPDVWRMAHRRVRPVPGTRSVSKETVPGTKETVPGTDRETEETVPGTNVGGTEVGEVDALLAGIQHHLKADEVFHKHPVFTEGERRLAQRFRDARVGAEKIGLFAHIGWELCLDGALLRREGVGETLKRLRQGLDAAQPHLRTAAEHHEPSPPDGFHDRLEALLHQIAWSDWVPGYTHGPGLARRLAGVRRRVRLPPFTDDDLERLGDVFESALDDAGPAVERFVEAWERAG